MSSTMSYIVTICGEVYDIISKRFEQEDENLPGIGAFYKNFETAVRSLTKSNVFMPPPRNYVYGQSQADVTLGHRMNGTPYPWYMGNDHRGVPYHNPPFPFPEDAKHWSFLLKNIEKQDHEDHKALELLWSWLGDYRRHTLFHIYSDDNLSTRDKITQMIKRHKTFVGASTNIIISRYKSQWHQLKHQECHTLAAALQNLHIIQNINNAITDLDIRQTYSSYEIAFEIIPTLQHNNFTPLIKEWNNIMTSNTPLHTASIQPSLEDCFLAKNSLNNNFRYAHVGKTSIPTVPSHTPRSPSPSPSSESPSKKGFAYAATRQDATMPTTQAQLNKVIADAIASAITANNQTIRQRSSSSSNHQRSRDFSRGRSRDRNSERQGFERRQDHRQKTSEDPRREQGRTERSMPRSPRERGDRSQSSDRSHAPPSSINKLRA